MKTITRSTLKWGMLIVIISVVWSCSVSNPEHYKEIRKISRVNSRQYKERELSCINVKRNDPVKTPGKVLHERSQNPKKRSLQKRKFNTYYSLDAISKSKMSEIRQNPIDSMSVLDNHRSDVVSRLADNEDIRTILPELMPVRNTGKESKNMADSRDLAVNVKVSTDDIPRKNAPLLEDRTEDPGHPKEGLLYLAVIVGGFLSFIGIKKNQNLSMQLASWAYLNPWKTRFIISGIHLFMGTTAAVLGRELAADGINLSNQTRNLFLAAFTGSALLYPVRKSKIRLFKDSFLRRKLHDILMVLSASVLMLFAGNRGLIKSPAYFKNEAFAYNQLHKEHSGTYPSNIILSRWNQNQDPSVHFRRTYNKTDRTILTIVLVLGFLGSLFGLFVFACSIWCNGMEALAVIVGIGGGALCILGLIWGMKGIKYMAQKEKQAKNHSF